jgi:hypothetical protein
MNSEAAAHPSLHIWGSWKSGSLFSFSVPSGHFLSSKQSALEALWAGVPHAGSYSDPLFMDLSLSCEITETISTFTQIGKPNQKSPSPLPESYTCIYNFLPRSLAEKSSKGMVIVLIPEAAAPGKTCACIHGWQEFHLLSLKLGRCRKTAYPCNSLFSGGHSHNAQQGCYGGSGGEIWAEGRMGKGGCTTRIP